MKRMLSFSAILLSAMVASGAAQTDTTAHAAHSAPAGQAASKANPGKAKMSTSAGQLVTLETAQGTIVIRLHAEVAPRTCANFVKLVKDGFYDGTYFHRVIPGFMIQGGDPNTKNADPSDDGMGGPGYTVPAEIKLPHLRGSVATARLGDGANPARASSGSQFFIDVRPQPSLDAGGYTVFGEVISGMEAVDKIVELANDPSTLRGAMGANPQKKALILHATVGAPSQPKPSKATP